MTDTVAVDRRDDEHTGRRVAWAGARLAVMLIGVTFLLMVFIAVLAGSVYVAGTIIASGEGNAVGRVDRNRAQAAANKTFDQMVQPTDPSVKQAGYSVERDGDEYRVQRAYVIPVLARAQIESRFKDFPDVDVTWTDDVDQSVGFGDARQRIPEGYNGLVLRTNV